MDCAACAQTVEKVVAALDGVRAARVSFGNATLAVDGDVEPDRVSAAVARAGLPRGAADAPAAPSPLRRSGGATRARVSTLGVGRAAGGRRSSPRSRARRGRSPSRCTWRRWRWAAGRSRARRWPGCGVRSLDMNVLMTLAAVGAVGIGAYAEGAWVLVLFAVGTTLETYAFDRSRRSVTELMELAPAAGARRRRRRQRARRCPSRR